MRPTRYHLFYLFLVFRKSQLSECKILSLFTASTDLSDPLHSQHSPLTLITLSTHSSHYAQLCDEGLKNRDQCGIAALQNSLLTQFALIQTYLCICICKTICITMWWETGWTTNVLITTCDEMHMCVGNMRQRTIKER